MPTSTHTALLHGRDLFDAGAFFEAHEVWEEAWLRETGPTRLLLQGLIQVAAALYKVSRAEHPRGAVRLFDAGLAKLEGISAADAGLAGLPLGAFLLSVRESREAARLWAAGEQEPPRPETYPKLAPG